MNDPSYRGADGSVRRTVLTASLYLGVFASGAFAADVVIRGNLGETLEGSDNYFLQNAPLGSTFKSLSTLNVDVLALTPGTRYLLSSNTSYSSYFGPGADTTSSTNGTPINETFRIDHKADLGTYFFAATYNRAEVAVTQLVESGFVTGQGAVNTVRILGGGTYDLGRRDLLSWSVQARNVTFDNDPGQTPYNDYAASLAWNHLIDPRTTLTTSVNFDWYDADDVFKSQRLFWQIMTGLTSQLTRRLTVNGSVGVSFANTWQNAVVVPLGTTTFQTGAANGWVGQVGLNYQLLQNHQPFGVGRATDYSHNHRPAAENDDGRIRDQSQYQCLVEPRLCCELGAHRFERECYQPGSWNNGRLFLGTCRLFISVGARLAHDAGLYL